MRILALTFSLLVVLFMVGCKGGSTAPAEASSPSDKTAYIEDHPSLSALEIECLKDGTPRVGITVSVLTEILGTPDETTNDDSSLTNESAVMTYSAQGKAYVVEDQGGVISIVSIRNIMSQE